MRNHFAKQAILLATTGLAALALPQSASADPTPECNVGAGGVSSTECGAVSSTGTATNATAVGWESSANANLATAIGSLSSASARFSTSLGAAATASAADAIAVGGFATASAPGAIAIGGDPDDNNAGARAAAAQSIAVGADASVASLALSGIAIGALATVSNAYGVAVGADAEVANVGGVALGQLAGSFGANATALGALSFATGANSVALGASSVAQEEGVVSVGSSLFQRRITNVAAGINSFDAVNLGQLNSVAADVSALQLAQDSLSSSVDTLFDLRHSDRRDMKQGVAAAMSMAQAPMPSGPGKVAYAVNGATFRGEYAVGGSLQYRLNTEAPMAVNVGVSFAGNKNNGLRVGVAGEF